MRRIRNVIAITGLLLNTQKIARNLRIEWSGILHCPERMILRACFHTFVFAAYPVLVVVGGNAGVLPLDVGVIARCLAISTAFSVLVLAALKPLIPDLVTRAACVSYFFIAFSLYALVAGTSTELWLAAVYTIASGAAVAFVVRPWRARPRKSTALNLGACAVLAANLYSVVPAATRGDAWRPAANALIDNVVASAGAVPSRERPDIYYIILDGFGRRDILRELYDLDLGPFVQALEARGFQVPRQAQSNYAQTFLSLSSSLNLSYLDAVTSTMTDSNDRRLLDYLIQQNALSRLAKRAGYRVVAVGSDYQATEHLETADECHCEQYGLHEIEAMTLNFTPFRALMPDRWTYDAHRRKIEQSFRHLRSVSGDNGPKLVFGHILAPHPPFVFEADGRPRSTGARMFLLTDGSQFRGSRGEYVSGYRAQAQFVARRMLEVVDTILSRPGPSPVIVMHGDHGPGSTWNWELLGGSNTRERMGIFSAYRLPGTDQPALDPHLTPVNGVRIVANRHLGTTLPPLPNRSYASTWKRPYEFVLVEPHAKTDTRTARNRTE